MSERGWTTPKSVSEDWGIAPLHLHGRDVQLACRPGCSGVRTLADSKSHRLQIGLDLRPPCNLRHRWPQSTLVQAGQAPAAMLTGYWRVIHIYIPGETVALVLNVIGMSSIKNVCEFACEENTPRLGAPLFNFSSYLPRQVARPLIRR
jgi:hypothetical protein